MRLLMRVQVPVQLSALVRLRVQLPALVLAPVPVRVVWRAPAWSQSIQRLQR